MAAKTPVDELKTLSVKNSDRVSGPASASAVANGTANGHAAEHSSKESDDDADEHVLEATAAAAADGGSAKKKKNRKRKPKNKKKVPTVQTEPPSVLISQLFPNNNYPKGEEVEYKDDNRYRTTDEEKRHLDKINSNFLSDYRQAAETHRQVRQWAQKTIKPGQTLIEIANSIEDSTRRLVGHDGLSEGDSILAGMGFPTGLNLDNIVAHYSPNAGCKSVLQQNNVIKVDIGVHINGRIVDSAFTMAFDPMYDNLLAAVKDATNTGVREAGIDVRVGELGGYIQEAMESYECEINGTTYPIKPIRNLAGHNILPYSIHGTKSVPLFKTDDPTKMEEGDVFAIETFGSTGNGLCVDQGEVSHYALRSDAPKVDLHLSSARSLLRTIKDNFGTIPFCRRYLDRIGQEKYLLALNNLVKSGIVEDYPPMVEKRGSYTAQFEHKAGNTAELQRLTDLHAAFNGALDGKLILASIDLQEPGKRILESGTADGLWLRDVCSSLSAPRHYFGSGIEPELFPAQSDGITYFKQSFNDPWPGDLRNSIDLVHHRGSLAGASPNEPLDVVKNLATLVKPGGWIQLQEMNGFKPPRNGP
ncbi:hypothetical protein DL769_004287 [Monosporascus sp. CRB-8-3]|nr:hypothetical protein DL769_004287 [Monosporascus sp. CRB-8-3]